MRNKVYPILVIFFGIASAHASEDVCSDPKDREFDFWIGEWDVVNRQANPGNPSDANLYPTGSATAQVFPVAGGCGVVELWQGELSWGTVRGFSLRSYDATTDKWTLLLNWPPPNAQVPAAFTMRDGEFRHGRGEFFSSSVGVNGETVLSRFTFSDIHAERYRWDGGVSADGGVNWRTNWIMEGTRRGRVDAEGLRPKPTDDAETSACAGESGSASLASFDGKWSGETSDGRGVQLEVVPVMGGCAVLEFLSVGGNKPFEEFRVRAYQTGNSSWTQFAVNNRAEGLVEFVGKAAAGQSEWSLPGSKEVMESWRLDDDKVLLWRRIGLSDQMISASLASEL